MAKVLKPHIARTFSEIDADFWSARQLTTVGQPVDVLASDQFSLGDAGSVSLDDLPSVKMVSDILVLGCLDEKQLLIRYLQSGGHTVANGGVNQFAPNPLADEGALGVAVGGSVSGVIDFTGDTDDITVFLISGQRYLVSLRGTGADPLNDSFLEVFDPSAALVNYNDDGGNDLYSILTFTAAATGQFTIRASSFSNPGDPGTGGYTVDVRVQGVDAVGDTNATSVVMTQGTTFGFRETATVSGGADLDRYQVTLEAGKFYTFKLAAGADYETDYLAVPNGEIDTILRLRNSAGTLVATNDDNNFPSDLSSGFGFYATVGGTYYLDVTGYAGQTGGYIVDFQQVDFEALDPLDAIDWQSADNIDTVDVVGVPTAYVYFGAAGETFGEAGLVTFGWNAKEKAAVMSALLEYTKITGIQYVETADVNQAEFRLNTVSTGNFGAYFYPQDPAYGAQQGIGIFNVNSGGWDKPGVSTQDIPGDQVSLDQGGFAFAVILHEFGHGHGLAHPHDTGGGSDILLGVTAPTNSFGIFNLNLGVYTVMSYNDAWDFHPDGPSPFTISGIGHGWSGTLSAFDIAELQQRYGVHANNTGDNVYTLPSVQQSGVYYETIWDTGGTDSIVYNSTGNARIDLTAATLDYSPVGGGVVSFVDQLPGTAGLDGIFGGFTIANGVVIEDATGGSGNDALIGNGVANVLTGNNGNDTLIGRGGDDTLHGGAGTDIAYYDGNRSAYTITAIISGGQITGFTIVDKDNEAPADSNNPVLVANEGTDTLDGIETLRFADLNMSVAGTVAVFDDNGDLVSVHTTIQAAIDDATTLDGYTIFASSGTFTEDLVVNKDLTIQGANNGVSGNGVRIAETVIDGGIVVTAAGVTIDGVQVTGTTTIGAFEVGIYLVLSADDFVLINSILDGPDVGPGAIYALLTEQVENLELGTNVITGYRNGVYISGNDTSGLIHDNLFDGDGSGSGSGLQQGIFLETSHVILDGNTFDGIDGAAIFFNPHGPNPVDLRTILLNTIITDSGEDRPVQVLATTETPDMIGTDFNEAFYDPNYGTPNEILSGLSFDGQGGNDHIFGNIFFAYSDEFHGGSGSDQIFGGAGDDLMSGDAGNDLLDGEDGIDTAEFADASLNYIDTVVGWLITSSEGNDFLQNTEIALDGTGQRNLLVGSTGFDTLQDAFGAAQDNDVLRLSQSGNHTGNFSYADAGLVVISQPGALIDATFSTGGSDGISIYGADGVGDDITTGAGDDFIDGGLGADVMAGGSGNDIYVVDNANDVVIEAPGEGDDRVFASLSYTLTAGQSIETLTTDSDAGTAAINLTGNEIGNSLFGNEGNNLLSGGGGNDQLVGYGGHDILIGGTGADAMRGGTGNDIYQVDDVNDLVFETAGEGDDTVVALGGYTLGAGLSVETLSAANQASTDAMNLFGNELGQSINGNAGANVLNGMGGNDLLRGYGGADIFSFTAALGAGNVDVIADMVSGTDRIFLDNDVFTGLGEGNLGANQFVIGSAAADADDRIIYNQATGQLFFDADGNGGGAAILFATVSGNPVLTASDFQII